ncbi:M9 family metallopeptidase N-terminal domain-containing protein [Kitasatospora sp. NPDC087314]|uniref:M9 family metallopeptidase N-terminal domain-containing protein n=1 Tax=Kitasatospora sp. NPDC087314 TaxID=3364068 RepID=UPI00381CEF30
MQGAPHTEAEPSTPAPARRALSAQAAACTPADFGSRSGADLVAFVQGSTTDCVNTLFNVTGTDAGNVFGLTLSGILELCRCASLISGHARG